MSWVISNFVDFILPSSSGVVIPFNSIVTSVSLDTSADTVFDVETTLVPLIVNRAFFPKSYYALFRPMRPRCLN